MAIKAGLVGVNPKGVDKNGMPIGSGGSINAYTKAETNTLLNGKVSNSQLTANNKAFYFAYDATSQKYGYKLDGAGDFIPFEQAGGGPGWVAPAELTSQGLNIVTAAFEYVEGGYYIDTDNDLVYVDLTVTLKTSSSGYDISGLPTAAAGYYSCLLFKEDGTPYGTTSPRIETPYTNDTRIRNLSSNIPINETVRICGIYPAA